MKNANLTSFIGIAVALLCAAYMAQWLSMPIYADEVADRMKAARLFHDDGMQYGLYSLCASNYKAIPLFFYPAAAFFALIDEAPLYLTARVIPVAALVFALAVFFFYGLKRKTGTGSLFLLSGFIGVAGSGLVLARPEFSLLFVGASCLWAYGLLREGKIGPRIASVTLVLLLFVFSVAAFHHVASLIYLPLMALLSFRLAGCLPKSSRAVAIATGIFILYAAYLSVVTSSVSCPEWPAVEAHRAQMTLTGRIFASDSPGFFAVLADRLNLERIWRPFIFFHSYVPDYLPGLAPEAAGPDVFAANQLARFFALFNMAALVLLALAAPVLWLRELLKNRGGKMHLASPKLFIALLAGPYVLLCLYDQQSGFYRPFHVNVVAAMLVAAFFSHVDLKNSQILKKGVLLLGLLAALACISSTVAAMRTMSPQLYSRQSDTDIVTPFALDWRLRNKTIEELAQVCGINDRTQNIIVDNTTYDAMKRHRHLIHVDYPFFANRNPRRPVTLKDIVKSPAAPQAMLTRCARFPALGLRPKASKGRHDPNPLTSYCCARF